MGKQVSRAEKLEEIEWLMSFGESPEYIANALGIKPNSVYGIGMRAKSSKVMAYFSDFAHSGEYVRKSRGSHHAKPTQ